MPSDDMNAVFGGGLWPLGWSVGYLERPLRETYARYRAWGLGATFDELGRRPILDALHELLPFEMPYTRRLLVGTLGGWTAIFDNSRLGGDPWPPTSYLAGNDTRGVIATHIPPAQYPLSATQFQLLGPEGEPPLLYARTIDARVFDSGRWTFRTWGTVQPFEQVEAYKKRRIRDRFNRELLVAYLAALGIDADEPDFYGEAVLVQEETRGWRLRRRDQWRASLERARRESLGELPLSWGLRWRWSTGARRRSPWHARRPCRQDRSCRRVRIPTLRRGLPTVFLQGLTGRTLRAWSAQPSTPLDAISQLSRARSRPGHMTPLHAHAEDEAIAVVDDTATVYSGEQMVQLEPGEELVVPAHELHAVQAGAGGVAAPLPATALGRWPSAEEASSLFALAAVNGIRVAGPPGTLPAAGIQPATA